LPVDDIDATFASERGVATPLAGTPAQGNVHAKTGTVDRSHALSGYVTTTDGKMLLFSFQANNYTVANAQVRTRTGLDRGDVGWIAAAEMIAS
jgi:D-alanyl-D-alanine carboxypeptidase/D-alanyl-D-alanine-endopeptidase (penicillin-binding protein 4)